MTDPLFPSGDLRIPIAELAKIAGVSRSLYYFEARCGRAPRPVPYRGVTLSEAKVWLAVRQAKKGAKAEAVRRLQDLLTADGLADAGPESDT